MLLPDNVISLEPLAHGHMLNGLEMENRETVIVSHLLKFHRYFTAIAVLNGYSVGEVRIEGRPRVAGKSKFGKFDWNYKKNGSSSTVKTSGIRLSSTGEKVEFVTVLFADLVGFTQFSEARDAEVVRAALTTYFTIGCPQTE